MGQPYIEASQFFKKINGIQEQFEKKELHVDACQLGEPDLKLTKILTNKESKSPTIIAFGVLAQEIDVVIKISFPPLHANRNQLEAERYLSEHVIVKMLKFTPHLVHLDQVRTCDQENWTSVLLTNRKTSFIMLQQLTELTKKIQATGRWDTKNKSYFLITELAPGQNMAHYCLKKQSLPQFWQPILFQLAYTLIVFEQFGFRHNDLHVENILIEKTDLPVEILYQINGIKYKMLSQYIIRLFDFDHAGKSATLFSPETFNNKFLTEDACPRSGECNDYVKNWDWCKALLCIYLEANDSGHDLSPVWETIIPREYLKKAIYDDQLTLNKIKRSRTGEFIRAGHACMCQDVECKKCSPMIELLERMKSPQQFILENYKSYQGDQLVDFYLPLEEKASGGGGLLSGITSLVKGVFF